MTKRRSAYPPEGKLVSDVAQGRLIKRPVGYIAVDVCWSRSVRHTHVPHSSFTLYTLPVVVVFYVVPASSTCTLTQPKRSVTKHWREGREVFISYLPGPEYFSVCVQLHRCPNRRESAIVSIFVTCSERRMTVPTNSKIKPGVCLPPICSFRKAWSVSDVLCKKQL